MLPDIERDAKARDIELREPNPLFALPALLAMGAVGVLALFPDARLLGPGEMGPEKLTLLFLAVCFLVALVPPLSRYLVGNRDAATWAVLVVGVILYHVAERAGPRQGEGFGLNWSLTPDDPLAISYAMRAVVFGALLSAGAWVVGGAPERALVGGLVALGIIGAAAFALLSRFYTVGVVETLDPTPLGTLIVQVVGYICLALCARAVTATLWLRRVLFAILPLLLLGLWARHQFAPIAAAVEAE